MDTESTSSSSNPNNEPLRSAPEKPKFSILGFPKNTKENQVRAMLRDHGIKYVKLRKGPRTSFAVVTMLDAATRDLAVEKLQGVTFREKKVQIRVTEDKTREFRQKREAQEESLQAETTEQHGHQAKKVKTSTEQACPWFDIPYQQQLVKKKRILHNALGKVTREVLKLSSKENRPLHFRKLEGREPCIRLEDCIPSPVLFGYRNKCEFSIGLNSQKNPCVGFNLGRFEDGVIEVGPVDDAPHVSDSMKKMVNVLQALIEKSDLPVWNRMALDGFWRQVLVRETVRGGDVLVCVIGNEDAGTAEQVQRAKSELVQRLQVENDVKVVLFQNYKESSNKIPEQYPFEVLSKGEPYIYETMCDLKFRISYDAFFQINTLAAEKLYNLVGEWAGVDKDTTVLDICCGTGTIGLTLARRAKQVVGVEMVASAIEDAKFNASLNGIENVKYICGKAEDVMYKVLRPAHGKDCIAIVDPPRSGLHAKVCKALRDEPNLKRLVYISCNSAAFVENAVTLMKSPSNKLPEAPFYPVKAMAVDMFPFTDKVELVVLMERQPMEDNDTEEEHEQPVPAGTATETDAVAEAVAEAGAESGPEQEQQQGKVAAETTPSTSSV